MQRKVLPHWRLTTVLLVVCVAVFLLGSLLSLSVGRAAALILGGDSLILTVDRQWWRLLLSGYVHLNPVHLLVNMYSLWNLGNFTESFYGRRKTFVVLTISIIAGSVLSNLIELATIAANPGGEILPRLSIGISGGLFGIMGLLLAEVLLSERRGTYSLPIDRQQLLYLAAANLLLGFISTNINTAAHIGGFLAGCALAFMIRTRPEAAQFINLGGAALPRQEEESLRDEVKREAVWTILAGICICLTLGAVAAQILWLLASSA